MVPVIGLASLAGEFEIGFSDTPDLLDRVQKQFIDYGFKTVKADVVMFDSNSVESAVNALKQKDFDVLCVCVGTWSEDHHLLDLLDYFDKPVILWAFPGIETGSLCGVQQICCVLKELGREYFYVYGNPEDQAVHNEIKKIAKAVALKIKLSHVRIGTIGGRIKGMTEIAFDEFEIKDRTGVRVVNLDEDELTSAVSIASDAEVVELWNNIKTKVGRVTSSDEHGLAAMKYYLGMKDLIKKYTLEGIVIKCYPRFMGKICLGYSMLSEEGIVCGCEGDVNNTVSMKILYELTGKPIHNTDLLYPDGSMNTILFSHCGSGGFSISSGSKDIHLAPVRLADTGVCALFPAKPGKVTLMNLVGRKGTYRMSVIVGDSMECGMEFPGNPLKVRFDRDILGINLQIAEEGIGHHWMGGYGDVSEELKLFAKMKGIRFIRL